MVANQGSAERPGDSVSVIDAATGTVLATLPAGLGAHGVAISPDGRRAFVTNTLADSLSVIDLDALRPLATFPVGHGPNGVVALGGG